MFRYLFILFCILPATVLAQGIINLDISKSEIPMDPSSYYIDEHDLSFDEISNIAFQKNFKPSTSRKYNLGYTNKTLWIKFILKSHSNVNDWVIDVGKHNLSLVELYYTDLQTDKWTKQRMGTDLKLGERSLRIRVPILQVNIKDYTSKVFYLKVRSSNSLAVTPTIYNNDYFIEKNSREEFFYGALFGVIFFAFASVVLLSIGSKHKTYWYFLIFAFFQSAFLLYITGYLHGALSLPYSAQAVYFIYMCSTFGGMMFSITFLNLKERLKTFYWLLLGSFVLVVLGFIATFFIPSVISIKLISILTLSNSILILIVCVILLIRGVVEARYYIWGAITFLLATITYILFTIDFLSSNFLTQNALSFGTLFAVLFLYLALSDRQRRLNREQHQAIQQEMLLQQSFTQKLEEEVNLRTDEIQNVNALLEENKQELENNQTRLERSNQTKNKLISIIAHDFKSPLNSLKGALSLLKMGALTPEETVDLASRLDDQVNNTLDFVNNLLFWTKSQMDGIKVKPDDMDLVKLITDIIKYQKPIANNKKIDLIMDDTYQEAVAWADKATIDIIIRNLISNAIKFTGPNGNILVSLREDREYWEVCVKDTGVGMSPEVKASIFKSDDSTEGTDAEKGTGLGLLLCRDYIHKNGGTIWVNSKPNEGSSFFFTLPKP